MNKFYLSFLKKNLSGFFPKIYFTVLVLAVAYGESVGQPADFNNIIWGTATSQPYRVNEAQGEVVNGKLYSFGGFDSRKSCCTPTKRAYVYDPAADAWSGIADLPHTPSGVNFGGVTHAGITTNGTDIFIAGGYTSNSAGTGQIFGTKQVWKYIVSQNIYTKLPDLPVNISAGQLEYLNNKLYHIGGTNLSRTEDVGENYVLDLNNMGAGWNAMAPLPNPRHHAGSAVYGGKIYYIGGQHDHDGALMTQKDVHVFDPVNNNWIKVADLPVPAGTNGRGHISSAVAVMGERILVLGGETKHGTHTNMVSAYSPATDTWENLTPLPQNRYSGVAGSMIGNIYHFGGLNSNTTYKGVPFYSTQSNALLFVENLDRFPSNDLFVFSRIQIPWSRDGITYNKNHDSLTVRIHNKGNNNLIISDLSLSNDAWEFVKLKGVDYVDTLLPLTVTSGTYADLTVKFVAIDAGPRVKILQDTLTIVSNDEKFPSKSVYFSGLWQKEGESNNEPYAQEIINAFGFKTKTGFNHTDPDKGDSLKLKGDEIRPSYFVRANASLPVVVRQMSAYHGCCTQSERIIWHVKGSDSVTSVFSHIGRDGQSVLPRRGSPNTPAEGSFNPTAAFGFKIGSRDWSDASKNPKGKTGIRVWKAYDSKGNIIPNAFIISNDYLGTQFTNYDYNDNMYFVKNIKPETGSAYFSTLSTAPSALDFGEKLLQTTDTLQLNLKSLGQVYVNGSQDPALIIDSVQITGENKSEFSADLPVKGTLNPQETTALTVTFNPQSQGLKIADLLIHYNNALSPHRVPLYGIAKAPGTTVTAHYRIKSGSSTSLIINGKTWSADTLYAFDNLEPYTNSALTQINGTDEDVLYLSEQSSNGDKKPFRYEIPVANGDYVVRLHFAEIYWGAPGSGLAGGAGSRVMSVSLENQLPLVNLDVTKEVGGATALVKNLPVTVTDGKLNITFSATVNRPMVNAVEVYSFFSALSANFLDFKGRLINKKVELEWVTSNEVNSKYFEVQRSNSNNFDFKTIGQVASNNIASQVSKYNFVDKEPVTANTYYRIKEVDQDGKFTFSKIIRIDFSNSFAMRLFPNPATNKIQIQFTGISGNQKANLSIQSISGSKITSIPIILSGEKTEIDISSLSAGIYIITLSSNNFVIHEKMIKNN